MSEVASLICVLKAQHKRLLGELRTFAEAPPASLQIGFFGSLLRAHIELEDRRFYPALEARGVVSRAVSAGFKGTLTALARTAQEFVGRWSRQEPHAHPEEFYEELARVAHDLGSRIRREEERLYPLLEGKDLPLAAPGAGA